MKEIIKKLTTIVLLITFILSSNINITFLETSRDETNRVKVFDKDNNIWNSKFFRIPSLQILSNGTILAFSDIRYNGFDDEGFIDIACARSTDNGRTWNYDIAMENDCINSKYSRVMDSTTVVTKTGRVILIAGSWNTDGNWIKTGTSLRKDWSVQMVYSEDNGFSWSNKINLTQRIKNQPSNIIGWLGGVGSGIVMENGTIVIPIQIGLRENNKNNYYSSIIYSNDNGETWTMGNKVPDSKTSENMVIELDGDIIMSCRSDSFGARGSYITHDLGKTWQIYNPLHKKIKMGNCEGSFIKIKAPNGNRIGLISAPKNINGGSSRDNITVYMINFDDLSKGIQQVCIPYFNNGCGYSCLSFNNNTLGILYETNGNIEYQDLTLYYHDILNVLNKKYEYLSNIPWEKATTVHKQVVRDMAHDGVYKLTLKSDSIKYKKGVGIHAKGEIVVDLSNKNYTYFSTDVGILQNTRNKQKGKSSINYKFYLDNKLVESTGYMYFGTPKRTISFNVKNASKLRIVVDSGSNNTGDWGVLGNARFIKSDNSVTYLSDISWEKATTQHKKVRRDIAHDGKSELSLKCDTITYFKGVGIHADGEIIVDLRGKGYKRFETSVGVLDNIGSGGRSDSSIQYLFYLDGRLVANTGVMNFYTPLQNISFDIGNASKLKIVVSDANNGNSGDWGVLGDAKFIF